MEKILMDGIAAIVLFCLMILAGFISFVHLYTSFWVRQFLDERMGELLMLTFFLYLFMIALWLTPP